MPRIPQYYLDCVVYLYPSVEDAKAGTRQGGTGFWVGVPFPDQDTSVPGARGVAYLVTPWHVAKYAPVPRVNLKMGGSVAVPLTKDHWTQHPDGDDLALCPVGRSGLIASATVTPDLFATEEHLDEGGRIGAGDDCFMLGRFLDHDGGVDRNEPSARFGNLTKAKTQRVEHEQWGIRQESFLVEARSLSGFSGSPVFAYAGGVLTLNPETKRPTVSPLVTSDWVLLGMDWGHYPIPEPVVDESWKAADPKQYVLTNSGLMMVLPAWKIQELLELPEFAEMRRKSEEEDRKSRDETPTVELDSARALRPSMNRDEFFDHL